jgi:transcriptional regulator with XRE-family HTH domain
MSSVEPSSGISAKASVAVRIRAARRAVGLSQQALADRLGIRRAAVTQWESTLGTLPSTINLIQAAVETRVSFEWLATGRGTMRLESSEGTAFSVECIAQSFEEEHLLALYRRCNAKQRESLVAFLAATAPDRRSSR